MRPPSLADLLTRTDARAPWGLLAASSLVAVAGLVAANGLTPWLERGALVLSVAGVALLAWREFGPRPRDEGLLDAVLRGSPLAIFALDRGGRVRTHWNPAAERRFGLTPGKAMGRPMPIVLAGFREELDRVLARVFQGEPVTDVPGQGLPRKGPSFPVNLSFTPIHGPGGAVAAALVVLGDDTAQKARVAALAALLGQKSALLDAVRAAGIVLWAQDPVSGRVVHASSAAMELLGVGREQLMADPDSLVRLLDPRDRDKFALARAEALAGHVGSFEAALAGPGTWTRWTLDLSGGLLRGVVQNINEAHDLQVRLQASQKLEAVGEFLSAVTHDFNNILMSILGYNELLLMDPDLSPEQKRRLQVMQRGASRGQALASRLLRYARTGGGAPRPADLNDLVGEVVGLLEASTPMAIRYATDLAPDLPPVLAEPTELHQVIMNLGVNARDAQGGAGEVLFRTRLAGAAERQALGLPDPCLVLEIQDTGPGIPEAVRERMFTPFFSTKAEGQGTGLGLAVVRRVVEAHGGQVHCQSRVGEGTLFQVYLPVRREAVSA